MPNFFCSWEEETSIVVDAEDETSAKKIATEIASGATPSRVALMPARVLALEVFFDDNGKLVVEPLPHTEEALERLESMGDGIDAPAECCGAEADYGDEVVVCTRPDHDDGAHEGRAKDGQLVTWDDEDDAAA